MSTSSTKRKAGDTQVIGSDEEDKTHKQEQDRQILENVMSINRRKRIAETQFINKHEANQICKEKGEEGCQTMGSCCNPELPAHIVIDILSRLPMKSLFNFRRVCKEWLSLISDPHFANLHLSKSQLSLLFKPLDCKRRSWKLNLVDLKTTPLIRPRNARKEFVTKINLPKGPNIPCNIVNSCNGLLCLSGDSNSNSGPCSDDLICICNPLLGELVTLPKCPSVRPISDLSCVAFGYSPMTDQYKVVQSFRSWVTDPVMDRETCEAEIYTLGEGSWRSIGKISTIVHSHSFNAFLNGSLHWLSHALSEDFIYCFDFGSEQFRAVPEPFEFGPVHRECSGYMYLGVLQGCLSICDFGGGGVAEVWVMKDYGVMESWSKNVVIDDCRVCYYEPILILEGGTNLDI
ncbi:F-box protein At3g07870-like [Rhododendron vialii]|uniref:F-box protein At3g07870-like n=1 Tax=Rhododendron vialii TaxID=182163 RepID=UPI00265DF18C|nr:F-box protein At3g07870-like [Rhododendron vialii]